MTDLSFSGIRTHWDIFFTSAQFSKANNSADRTQLHTDALLHVPHDLWRPGVIKSRLLKLFEDKVL